MSHPKIPLETDACLQGIIDSTSDRELLRIIAAQLVYLRVGIEIIVTHTEMLVEESHEKP